MTLLNGWVLLSFLLAFWLWQQPGRVVQGFVPELESSVCWCHQC